MHLLVLSAFRRGVTLRTSAFSTRVSMHLLVLSAFRLVNTICIMGHGNQSQCTFWCSVLSDRV